MNMLCSLSVAVFIASVEMPTAPIHRFSSAPMANNAMRTLPMRGVSLVVYPAESNISRSSGQSWGWVVAGVALLASGRFHAGDAGTFKRAGRAMLGLGALMGCGAGVGVGIGSITGAGAGADSMTCVAAGVTAGRGCVIGWGAGVGVGVGIAAWGVVWGGVFVCWMVLCANFILRMRGLTSIYSPPNNTTTATIIDT